MKINADFSERVVVDTAATEWTASPRTGVDRKMLERIGQERARSTSIVRYAPGASFDEHVHPHGEEIFVIEGTYADDHGAYPMGTYLRLPWGSKHAPSCPEGCLLLVKNGQLPAGERRLVVETTAYAGGDGGVERRVLFESARERVSVERIKRGARATAELLDGGIEIYVLNGELEDERGRYPRGTWLRLPPQSTQTRRSTVGASLWVKRGHLASWNP